MISDFVMKAFV